MNIKEIELQAKALAPIISNVIASAIESMRSEMMMHIDEMAQGMDAMKEMMMLHIKEMKSEMKEYMDECMAAMPMPMDGKDGMNGVDGKDGTDGKDGRDGMDGKDGESISMEEMQNEIARQIALIELPVDGVNGQDGKDGQSVSIDDVQKLIDAEVKKRMALIQMPADGRDGINGKDGQPGRDAANIEILPGIDEEKSYVRGTYAKYNGGLWRSYEQTFGLKGWECIVDGVANLTIDQEGERGFKAIAQLSSGAASEKTITIPAQINRGVWREGIYEKGDVVTWGGSQWHCEDITEDKPGQGSKDWLLIVKCGRPGKDGINGKDAPGVVKL